jgi:Nuclease A inhibitor-like protein
MTASATAAALQQAADELTYPSETDAPWEAFAWPTAQGEPTAAGVLKLGRHKPKAPVEEQSVEALFAPLVQEQDWYGPEEKAEAAKYRSLREAVMRLLAEPKVFRVGRRKVTVYVVGEAPEGGWAGLKTTAVET